MTRAVAGTWICSQCGSGDGIELVKRLQNVEFRDAARLIEQHIGTAPVIGIGKRQAPTDGQKRQEMIDLWKRSRQIARTTMPGAICTIAPG